MKIKNTILVNKQIDIDQAISFVVCSHVSLMAVKNALVQGIPQLYAINSYLNILLLVLIGSMYICLCIKYIGSLQRIRTILLGTIVFFIGSFAFSYCLYDTNRKIIISLLPNFISYFLAFILLSNIRSFFWIEYYMMKYSILISIAGLITVIFIRFYGHITVSTWSTYSMPLSNSVLLATMWMIYGFFERRKKGFLLVAVLDTGIIFLYGARSPLLSIAAYVFIIASLMFIRKSPLWIKILYITFINICVILLLAWQTIIGALYGFFVKLSIPSRLLYYLMHLEEDFSTGRNAIHESIRQVLLQHPFRGLGVGGDIATINESAHSVFWCVLSSYGYIIGGLVIFFAVILSLKAYGRVTQTDKNLVLLYLCLVWPRSFTGGDIWTSEPFWWMLGICIVAYYGGKNSATVKTERIYRRKLISEEGTIQI